MSGAKIFAFANQKGGVGKTTSCVNLAASLSYYQKRVLLLDMDPQGNATMGSGVNKLTLESSMNELLQGQVSIDAAIVANTPAGYDLVGTNSDLTEAEAALLKKTQQQYQLKTVLAAVRHRYDYIFIDCPPSLNMLTLNALVAADSVMIVMQCEYYALEGLTDLVGTVRQIQATCNADLQIGGIIRTMFDPRSRLCCDVSDQLIKHFPDKIFKTTIPRNVRLAEAPSHGLPVCLYDNSSKGAIAYLVLASEFDQRFSSKPATAENKACEEQNETTQQSEAVN
ncbi:MAG: ParA family protein [Pseudomonadota bacterium]